MTINHPYINYGLAFVFLKEKLDVVDAIEANHLIRLLEEGLSNFRISTDNDIKVDKEIKFESIHYKKIISQSIKGDTSKGIYLAPNVISDDLKANNTWQTTLKLLKVLQSEDVDFHKSQNLTMGIAPIAGELNNGTKSKKNVKGSILDASLSAITTLTPTKPTLSDRKKGKYINTTIIPDLTIDKMIDFISIFSIMLDKNIDKNKLYTRKVYRKEGKKAKYSRPPIYNGNFPYAPRNSAFGVVSLLASIGRWTKEAGYSDRGQKVLESLNDVPLYIIQYGNAKVVTVNHWIIDLAKENELSYIVNDLENSYLIHPFDLKEKKGRDALEHRKNHFAVQTSRFLELFDKPSFKDFLSIRSQYKARIGILLNTFFEKQMKISKEIIDSVSILGQYLNKVAYIAGKKATEEQNKKDKLYEFKAKALIELESSVFGARKNTELVGNVITRAGRISGRDAPFQSKIFIDAVLSEEINLDDAKSMLMAYSRIINIIERDENPDKQEEETQSDDNFNNPDVTN